MHKNAQANILLVLVHRTSACADGCPSLSLVLPEVSHRVVFDYWGFLTIIVGLYTLQYEAP